MFKLLNQPRFLFGVLVFAYLIFQLIQIPYTKLAVDEFFFAHHIHQFTQHLPYRDFPPYKTVFGYYLLSPFAFIIHDSVNIFFYIKDQIALINTIFFVAIGVWARRFFSMSAIFLTCAFIIANQLFLIYSVDLRVDMLTCWFGLFAFLCILSNRFFWAGFIVGVAFLISQKALWFWAAIDIALTFYFFLGERRLSFFRQIVLCNLAAILPIAGYILFWSYFSSLTVVLQSVFYEAYLQSKITYYAPSHYGYWAVILFDGPLLMLAWPLTWIPVFLSPSKNRILITVFGICVLLFVITYQQAFPYNTVFLFPGLFLVYADFLTWWENERKNISGNLGKIYFYIIACTIYLLGIVVYFRLPLSYYFVLLVPILFMAILKNDSKKIYHALLVSVILYTGLICPLIHLLITNVTLLDGRYQQSMIRLADSILEKEDSYLAGTPFMYDKDQTVSGLKNLIDPAIAYLYQPSADLKPIFLESLYMVPRTVPQVLQDLARAPVKLYINNARLYFLPDSIKSYLAANYQHYWGSIYLYAPIITRNQTAFTLKFDGNYRVNSAQPIKIDGRLFLPRELIYLRRGIHGVHASADFRLNFAPKGVNLAPYAKYSPVDGWYFILKKIVL